MLEKKKLVIENRVAIISTIFTYIGGFPTNNVWVHLNLKKVFNVFDAFAGLSKTI